MLCISADSCRFSDRSWDDGDSKAICKLVPTATTLLYRYSTDTNSGFEALVYQKCTE